MKYSCHIYNNSIWFWYNLIRTNPDWCCFQQNYRGVIFCAEIKVLQMQRNFLTIFLDQKRPPKLRGRTRSLMTRPQGITARPGGHVLLPCGALIAPFRVIPTLKNPVNRETPWNKHRTLTLPPQPSVLKKYHLEPCSGTLSEGGIITGGHLYHPGGLHDEEGVVHPRGWGYVLVAMCLISLSLSRVLDLARSWCIVSFVNIVGSYGVSSLSIFLWWIESFPLRFRYCQIEYFRFENTWCMSWHSTRE